MKPEDLAFPVTPERFIAYQEAGIGRNLNGEEREIIGVWVPFFNDAYDDGRSGQKQPTLEALVYLDEFIRMYEDEPILKKILQSIRWRTIYALDRGLQDAGKAVPV